MEASKLQTRLKVALLSLPPRTQAVLDFFFSSSGRSSFAPSGEEVADDIIAISTRLEDYQEERYLRETGQMIARYAASRSISEGQVVLEIVRIATDCGLRTPPELSVLGKALLNLENVCHSLAPALDVRAIVERQLQSVLRARLKKTFSRANVASEMMELQQLARLGPRRISEILGLLAENRLQMKVTGLEESRLMENIQKVANRVAAGLISSALLLSAAMLMRIESGWTLFGYPVVALVLLLIAVIIALGLILSSLLFDHRTQAAEREERGLR